MTIVIYTINFIVQKVSIVGIPTAVLDKRPPSVELSKPEM